MLRKSATALAVAVVTALAVPASAATGPYDAGASDPVQDSYYPAHGSAGIDVLHYGLDLSWQPAKKLLTGTATLTIRPTADAKSFQLDLGAPLRVTRLTVDGTPARRTRDGNHLVVARKVVADTDITVQIGYQGTPKPATAPTDRSDFHGLGWHFTKAGAAWAMQEPFGAFTWYPVNDTPSDKALYDVRIHAPKGMVGVSNGTMTSRTTTKIGRTVTTFTNTDPMASYLVTIAIGDYQRHQQTGPHGLPLTYWVPRAHPEYLKPLLSTPAALKWLEGRLGAYPFTSAGVVVIPTSSAMETQTMVTLGGRYYGYGGRSVRETVAHELAHAWYGDTVTPTDWRDLWMNEGFAMYVQARYSAHMGWRSWDDWRREFTQNDQYWRDIYGPPGHYRKQRFGDINVYYCTARMLIRLRSMLGASTFDALLKEWPAEMKNRNKTRGGYVGWVDEKTGKDLTGFFSTWLNSATSPA
ncbi:MAG: M1 family metallopeptidase [Nocardioidaceae bacterium]